MLGRPKDKKTRERQRVAGSFSKSALRSRRFNYSLESLPILDITLMLLEQRVEKREAGLNRLYENFVDFGQESSAFSKGTEIHLAHLIICSLEV